MIFIILPNQLFDIKLLKNVVDNNKIKKIILYEHPQYFLRYKFNKKKLLLHFASMNAYYDLLKSKLNNIEIVYITYKNSVDFENNYLNKNNKIFMFKPSDNLSDLKKNINFINNPNFLLSDDMREKFFNKNNKTDSNRIVFNNFYMWSKKILNILPEVKSKDKENRKILKNNLNIPSLPKLSQIDLKYINNNINKLNNFKNNYGNVDNFFYPVTRNSALIFLKDFIKNRFKLFGDYQDYVKKNEPFMFHSVLSSSLNIGLINPSDVINEIFKIKNKIPLNSFEGFVRQLFWREYQKYCYEYIDYNTYLKSYNKSNHKSLFKYKNKINKNWYNGTIKINNIDFKIINDTIKKGFDNAYLHHIERLMIIGNFMNISEIHPKDGFKWFMEFSIDSYEWVMYQNVYDMVFYVTGLTMRKPYITKSNYIIKMTDYNIKDDKDWINKWDEMYITFIKKYKSELIKKHSYYFPSLKSI